MRLRAAVYVAICSRTARRYERLSSISRVRPAHAANCGAGNRAGNFLKRGECHPDPDRKEESILAGGGDLVEHKLSKRSTV
jgi:hypothetical protein